MLIDIYVSRNKKPDALATLYQTLILARWLAIEKVDPDELHGYLFARWRLKRCGCSFEDVPEALRVLELLDLLPTAWTWDTARAAMQGVADLIHRGIPAEQVEEFLRVHQRLKELGFDAQTAEQVANALDTEGAFGAKRDRVLHRMVQLAGKIVDAAELGNECERLEHVVAVLKSEHPRLVGETQRVKRELEVLTHEEGEARRRLEQVHEECALKARDLEVLRGLRAFLLRRSAQTDAIWKDLECLLELRRSGQIPEERYAIMLSDQLQAAVFAFIQDLTIEAKQST